MSIQVVPLIDFVPKAPSQGAFGVARKHDVHTGVDLYTHNGAPVRALQAGEVVKIEDFTGAKAQSPWWNETQAVLVENDEGVIVYGEMTPKDGLSVGSKIQAGDLLGQVKQVLKKDKGKNPPSMLHLEYMRKGSRDTLWWQLGEPQPASLLSPDVLLSNNVYLSSEYVLIRQHYNNQVAKRSQVPLINHIGEGVEMLISLGSTLNAQKAFCLHPLLQSDDALKDHYPSLSRVSDISPEVWMLTMEYRNIANQYLSLREIHDVSDIRLSPLTEVNDMLKADKLQNYKDFLIHHRHTHPRAEQLDRYFQNWLTRLEIPQEFWPTLARPVVELQPQSRPKTAF